MRASIGIAIVAAACGAIFKPTRKQRPDRWSLEAAAIHAMVTPPQAFLDGDCAAAPMPDLELFCAKKCDQIGELSLKGYCAWSCDDVKNPDLAVVCRLEIRRDAVDAKECAPIGQRALREHCERWVSTGLRSSPSGRSSDRSRR